MDRSDILLRFQRLAFENLPGRVRLPVRVAFMRAMRQLEPEMAWLDTLAKPDSTAVDVGANHGIYTHALTRVCQRVHAFEPQPWCAETIQGWRNPKVEVHQLALSDNPGELHLTIPLRGRTRMTGYATTGEVAGPADVITVEAKRLDDLRLGDISFVKIDVEGHELAVVRGAKETLTSQRPNLLVEIEQRHLYGGLTVYDVLEEIHTIGFDGFFLDHGSWRSTDEFDLERDQHAENAEVKGARYVFMFAFQPAGHVTLPGLSR